VRRTLNQALFSQIVVSEHDVRTPRSGSRAEGNEPAENPRRRHPETQEPQPLPAGVQV